MRAKHRKTCYRGFTLIELLLALAVLTVVATIVVPSFFRSYFQHRAMDQAIASVMESMLTAKQLAVQSASPYVYEFTRGSNVQHIYPLNGPQNGSATKRAIILPIGFRLECSSQEVSDANRMIFREDGSTEGLVVLIVGESQTQPIQVQRRLGIPQRVTKK